MAVRRTKTPRLWYGSRRQCFEHNEFADRTQNLSPMLLRTSGRPLWSFAVRERVFPLEKFFRLKGMWPAVDGLEKAIVYPSMSERQ